MSKSLVKNASDEKQVKAAGKKEKRNSDEFDSDLRFILSSDQGKRVFWQLLERCGVFRSSFTGNSHTFFKEGERNIGLSILTDVSKANPEALIEMMKNKHKGENDE